MGVVHSDGGDAIANPDDIMIRYGMIMSSCDGTGIYLYYLYLLKTGVEFTMN